MNSLRCPEDLDYDGEQDTGLTALRGTGVPGAWLRAGEQPTPSPMLLVHLCALTGAADSHASSLMLKSMFSRLCHYYTLFQSSVLLGAVQLILLLMISASAK